MWEFTVQAYIAAKDFVKRHLSPEGFELKPEYWQQK